MTEVFHIIDVTKDNVADAGVYCIKNKKAPGYRAKLDWFNQQFDQGLAFKIVEDGAGKQLGFIEYLPAEYAWRPVNAPNWLFVQCIALFAKEAKGKGAGSMLLQCAIDDAQRLGKHGVCVMSSEGVWMAGRALFEKHGFEMADSRGRFDLLHIPVDQNADPPRLFPWDDQLPNYQGWHLLYADQCPWHCKSVQDLSEVAAGLGIDLQVSRLEAPVDAQLGPSGFGTYALIRDGRLLADHYISRTRFLNIVKKELQ